jgi:hypothetical protein
MKLLHIQHAGSTDADSLSRIAYISKKFWGYPNEWMDVWRPILTLDPESLTKHPAYVAHVNEQFIGFYQLALGGLAELKHLWVLPQWMGQEVGKQLFCTPAELGGNMVSNRSASKQIRMRSGSIRKWVQC